MEAIKENSQDIVKAMPWLDINKNIKTQITTFVLESEIQNRAGEIHLWTIRNNLKNEFVGLVGVDKMTHQGGDWNFGYWIKKSFQKKGIASVALPNAIKWLSKHYNSTCIEISVKPENISGLATCKHILRTFNISNTEFKKTILNHNGEDRLYHTYIIKLNDI